MLILLCCSVSAEHVNKYVFTNVCITQQKQCVLNLYFYFLISKNGENMLIYVSVGVILFIVLLLLVRLGNTEFCWREDPLKTPWTLQFGFSP